MLRKFPRNCELIEGLLLVGRAESGGLVMEDGFVAVIGRVIVPVLLSSGMISSDVEGTGMARIKMKRVVKITKYFLGGTHEKSSLDLVWKNRYIAVKMGRKIPNASKAEFLRINIGSTPLIRVPTDSCCSDAI